MRPGWRLTAVGGARRSAYNAGINVRRTVFLTYVCVGHALRARRLPLRRAASAAPGADTGVGLEVSALTAAVLGGNSLGGGRGSVAKAIMGALLVLIADQRPDQPRHQRPGQLDDPGTGAAHSAVFVDMRWLKQPPQCLAKVYVSPAYLSLPPRRRTSTRRLALCAQRPAALRGDHRPRPDRGPRGRHPRPRRQSLLRHPAWRHRPLLRARPQALARCSRISAAIRSAWRSTATAICSSASAAWVSIQVAPDRTVTKLTDETNRSWTLGRRRFAPAPGRRRGHRAGRPHLFQRGDDPLRAGGLGDRRAGKPWRTDASSATIRRPARRTRSSRNWSSPNGVCMCPDGQSFLFAESWTCRISRYWFDGPKKGKVETCHRQPAGLSRQHQPRLGRQLLAGAARHAHAGLDLALRMPGLPQAHGPARCAGSMALSQHQHRLRGEVRREGPRSSTASGISAAATIR